MSDELKNVARTLDNVRSKAREIKSMGDVEAFAETVTRCLETIYSALDQLKHRHEHGIRE
jgi:hypothetical protein